MDSAVMTMESMMERSKKLVTGETAPFCPDLLQLKSTKTQEPQSADPSSISMGACYPKCMGSGDDTLVLPGAQDKRTITSTTAALYETELVSRMQTFDLEELGLAAASQSKKQEKGIVVDYEDSDEEHPEPRDQAATCAPSACAPVLTSADGRPSRRRSRCGSDLRGKSVIFETADPTATSSSDTDAEEDERCSKVHKLCMCEVKLHRSLESCWLVSGSQVYDVTGLVTAHPGGVRSILRKAGGPDCARDMKFHTKNARKMMEKCFIGKLQQCGDDVDCSGEGNCSIM
ncbi:hypothetical protein V7S43_014139 [Phytophthora oleae]|uniref:Cytochrome b5 heme-binding domain-containing protein n=1 Tax=Phytophthora oleae TaxID=2107226 RepID=A0ABD3F2U8_9STRA